MATQPLNQASRIEAAQARLDAIRNPPNAPPSQVHTKHPTKPVTKPATRRLPDKGTAKQGQAGPQTARKQASDGKMGKSDPIFDREAAALEASEGRNGMSAAQEAQLVAMFRQHASNDVGIELVKEQLPSVWWAMLAGAKKPGLQGAADRKQLFIILGLPWASTVQRATPADRMAFAIGDRLGRALSRLADRVGHQPVTINGVDMAELADAVASDEVAHQLPEPMPYQQPEPGSLEGE